MPSDSTVYRGTCDGCGAQSVLLTKYDLLHPATDHKYLCHYCEKTMCGRILDDPREYTRETRLMMQHTCALANLVEGRVRRLIEDLGLRMDAPAPLTDEILGVVPRPEDPEG